MKVLVYGAGVQGGLLAHVLVKGQNDVAVLARGGRAEELRKNGIVLRHYFQRKTTVDRVKIITELAETDVYDVIFVTMKYTDFPAVLPVLARNGSTNIVLVGNNATAADMESVLQESSQTPKNVAFGFQISGGKREENRTIIVRFNAGALVIGGLRKEVAFKDVLEKAFVNTKFKINYEKNIDAWLKSHIITVLPMNLAAFLKDYNFKAVARDNNLLRQTVAAMDEGFNVLKDTGYPVIPPAQANLVKRHKNLAFIFYKLFHYSPLANQVAGSFTELKGLYEDFYKLKVKSAEKTPNLDLLKERADLKDCQEPAAPKGKSLGPKADSQSVYPA